MTGPSLPRLLCHHCRDVIGVYEPVVLVDDAGGVRETAAAAERGLALLPGLRFHRACFAAAGDLSARSAAPPRAP